jgi:glycosyltransferase involved in cell wall biosynthesis
MSLNYDFVIITNIPSFYKINLYNHLSKKYKIKVIFISATSVIRPGDFYQGEMKFEYTFISDRAFEERNKIVTLYKIYVELRNIKFKKIIYPGWEIKELLILSILTPYKCNAIAVETCILETKKTPLIWWIKKLYVNRMSLGLPSGELQAEIFRAMNFRGRLIHTNGVGVPHDSFYVAGDRKSYTNCEFSYLYVGRLSEEKNPEILCKAAIKGNKKLTVVGYGPQESELKDKYASKIDFLGRVNNNDLKKIYKEHDILVVPSKTEAWGLVIDEALCSGLVIIASDQVGSINDLVLNKDTGVTFDYRSEDALLNAMNVLEKNYAYYQKNVNNLDLKNLLLEKIEPYSHLLDEIR